MISLNSTPTPDAPQARKTYPQDWPRYNAAQVAEKSTFTQLLADLCSTIQEPAEVRRGRPNLPLPDMVFCMDSIRPATSVIVFQCKDSSAIMALLCSRR